MVKYKNSKLYDIDVSVIESVKGDKEWYYEGKLHREDGPVIEYVEGTKEWCLNGVWMVFEWYLNGIRYRARVSVIEYADGRKEWWFYWVIRNNKYSIQTCSGYYKISWLSFL